MIEFSEPPLTSCLTGAKELNMLLPQCSSAIGFCIRIGNKFFCDGLADVDNIILPLLRSKAKAGISPRVLSSYSILLWFAQQVSFNYAYITNVSVTAFNRMQNGRSIGPINRFCVQYHSDIS